MKSFRFLTDRWPLICLSLVTTIVVIWAGVMVHEVTAPAPDPLPVAIRPLPSPTLSIPASAPTAPLQVPSSPLTAPLMSPTTLPSQSVLPKPSSTISSAPVLKGPTAPQTMRYAASPVLLPQARYGHLPYAEAAPDRLVSIGTYGEGEYKRTESLDQDAAAAFEQMVAAAKADGVSIIPISGFRTIADQEKLFERQIQRQGSESAAATLSAPPGYSEHHTGYALDVGDGVRPRTDVKFEFEQTAAYGWMATHARRYGFELSFPRNNPQGVSFEPWHWRFINSGKSSAVFTVAHTLAH